MRLLLPAFVPLLLWQTMSWASILPHYVLPAPSAVLGTLMSEWFLLSTHMMVTLGEIFLGMVIGAVLGIATALAAAVSPQLHRYLRPWLVGTQALPVFVLAPVLTIWFGYGPEPKVAMTVLLVYFPIASGFLDGLLSTPSEILDLAKITRCANWRALVWLRIPHALPHLGAGVRIAVTYAPTGAVIGEWVGASKGLGYLMLMSNARMKIDLMFAALVLIVAITFILNMAANHLLRRWAM